MRFAVLVFILMLFGFAMATMSTEELTKAKQLIDSNVSCGNLSDSQLELIGEYYMEQMHPGQAHEVMDQMMGGEGSQSLKSVHIQMAEVLYCGKTGTPATYGGMMGMMPMMGRFAGGGMMRGAGGYGLNGLGAYGLGNGMMGGYGGMMGYGAWGWQSILFWLLAIAALVLLVFWLYKKASGDTLSAAEILKRRYAKGEISKKKYAEMKKDLD